MLRSSSSRGPPPRRDTLPSPEEILHSGSILVDEINLRSPTHHDPARSPTISIPLRNHHVSAGRSPISPVSPAMVFSHRPRSSSVSSSDFEGVILTERATGPYPLGTQEQTRHSSAERSSSTDSLAPHQQGVASSGSPRQDLSSHSPVQHEAFSLQSGLETSMSGSAQFVSGPVSPTTAGDSDQPRRVVRRVSSNPTVYSLALPSQGDESTPKRTKGNFFKLKGLLGKNR